MPEWSLIFTNDAKTSFSRLDKTVRRRVAEKLDWFVENFDFLSPLSLAGEYREFYKLRVGNWRIIYKISLMEKVLIVTNIEHRSKAYRKKK